MKHPRPTVSVITIYDNQTAHCIYDQPNGWGKIPLKIHDKGERGEEKEKKDNKKFELSQLNEDTPRNHRHDLMFIPIIQWFSALSFGFLFI